MNHARPMQVLGALAAGLLAAQAGSTPGYLAVAGPVALRFQVAPPPAVLLPPLKVEDAANASETASPSNAAAQADGASQPQTQAHLTTPVASGTATNTPARPNLAETSRPLVTPQMLMRYVTETPVGEQPAATGAPLSFNPPPVPSSTAVYQSLPKQ